MTEHEVVRVPCNNCNQRTNHRTLYSYSTESEEREESSDTSTGPAWMEVVMVYETCEVLQCMGCNTVTFSRRIAVHQYDHDTTDFYPPRIFRRLPKWQHELPLMVGEILRQVYAALQNGHGALALMGARTIVDLVFLDKVGDKGNFPTKVAALHDAGLIGTKAKDVLLAALDAGSAAVHRGFNPRTETVGEVMDIVENLLEATYRLDSVAERLKKSTPARSRDAALRALADEDGSD